MRIVRCDRGRHGFTLLELLQGVLMFSLVALGVYAVFAQGLSVERRLRNGSVMGQELFWASQSVIRDVQAMALYTAADDSRVLFEGGSDRLSLITVAEDGLRKVQYELEEPEREHIHYTVVDAYAGSERTITAGVTRTGENAMVLVRKEQRFPFQFAGDEGLEKTVLTEKVTPDGLRFSFFERDEESGGRWKDQWDREEIPPAIRMDLTLNAADGAVRIVRDIFVPLAGISAEGAGVAK